MKRICLLVLFAGLVAGCSATQKAMQAPAPTTLAGTIGQHPVSAQVQASGPLAAEAAPSADATPARPAPKGQCDAPALAYLIGRPRTEIPVPADLSRRRVACTTCPVSEDYRPDRTNILFNAASGIVTAVKCG